MKSYYSFDTPKKGRAKIIWDTLESRGIIELHYNYNCFGKGKDKGWGSWACTFIDSSEWLCGIEGEYVYIQQLTAPYKKKYYKIKKLKNRK